jgi:hypothetical protein
MGGCLVMARLLLTCLLAVVAVTRCVPFSSLSLDLSSAPEFCLCACMTYYNIFLEYPCSGSHLCMDHLLGIIKDAARISRSCWANTELVLLILMS